MWVKARVKALVKAVLKCLLNCTPGDPTLVRRELAPHDHTLLRARVVQSAKEAIELESIFNRFTLNRPPHAAKLFTKLSIGAEETSAYRAPSQKTVIERHPNTQEISYRVVTNPNLLPSGSRHGVP